MFKHWLNIRILVFQIAGWRRLKVTISYSWNMKPHHFMKQFNVIQSLLLHCLFHSCFIDTIWMEFYLTVEFYTSYTLEALNTHSTAYRSSCNQTCALSYAPCNKLSFRYSCESHWWSWVQEGHMYFLCGRKQVQTTFVRSLYSYFCGAPFHPDKEIKTSIFIPLKN
jgi:hypothetical protein